jgi:hypothetical protein
MHISLTSALAGGEWSASRPGLFTPEERASGTYWIEGWVDPRAGLDMEKRTFFTLSRFKLQPVASRYTDYAIPALDTVNSKKKKNLLATS